MSAGDTAAELDIIDPDRELTLGGETVTVREFNFLEGMRMGALADPMVVDLGDLLTRDEVSLESLMLVFSRHESIFLQLMATSVGRTSDWVGNLSDGDGQLLAMTFWTVNRGFFLRRVLMQRRQTVMRDEMAAAPSDPANSSAP